MPIFNNIVRGSWFKHFLDGFMSSQYIATYGGQKMTTSAIELSSDWEAYQSHAAINSLKAKMLKMVKQKEKRLDSFLK